MKLNKIRLHFFKTLLGCALTMATGPGWTQNAEPKVPIEKADLLEIEILSLEAPDDKNGDGLNRKHDVQIGLGFQMTEETRYLKNIKDRDYSKAVAFPNHPDFLSRLFFLKKGETWQASEGDEKSPADRVILRVKGEDIPDFLKSLPDPSSYSLRLGIIEKGNMLPGSRELMFSKSVDPDALFSKPTDFEVDAPSGFKAKIRVRLNRKNPRKIEEIEKLFNQARYAMLEADAQLVEEKQKEPKSKKNIENASRKAMAARIYYDRFSKVFEAVKKDPSLLQENEALDPEKPEKH